MHSWKRSCTGCTPRPRNVPAARYSMHCTGQNSGHLPHGKHKFTSMNATSRGRFFFCPTSSGVSGIRSSLRRRLIMSMALIPALSPFLVARGQAARRTEKLLSDAEDAPCCYAAFCLEIRQSNNLSATEPRGYVPAARRRGNSMQTRIVQMGAAIAAVTIALMVARTEAFASSHESCSATSTNVTSGPGSDGVEATCNASTGAPNTAKASATGSDADAEADAEGHSTAKATSKGANADATADAGGGSGAKATAKGLDSDATADAAGGSMAVSSAKGSSSDATAESDTGSDAKATASGKSSDATSVAAGGSMAVSSAKGTESDATAAAENGSSAKATASGTDSLADASATKSGSEVTALATKGSTAIGSDAAPPTCTPKNGGVAKVKSPMGNCP